MSFNRIHLVGAAICVGLIVPASAMAATIIGGPGAERLRGTNVADVIHGNGGLLSNGAKTAANAAANAS